MKTTKMAHEVHTMEETNNSKLITKYVEVITGATFAVMFDIKPGPCLAFAPQETIISS